MSDMGKLASFSCTLFASGMGGEMLDTVHSCDVFRRIIVLVEVSVVPLIP
jgi:hypothetical protein